MAEVNRPTVSVNQAAEICDVNRRTIYTWIQAGKVDTVKTPTGRIRIYTDTLFPGGHRDGLDEQGRLRSKLYPKNLRRTTGQVK